MARPPKNVSDHLVQAGRPDRREGRQVNMPLELGSTMVFDTLAAFEAAREARYETGNLYYGRYGNSATYALETALAGLEGADGVTLTSSGVAAITTTLMALAAAGDHVLVADNVYGNTRGFCELMLPRQGVEVEFYDPMIGAGISALFRPETRVVMFEGPGSGTFEVPDIPAIAAAARAAGVATVFDATWPSPVFCQPLALGVDVVVASGSKYLSGHSDLMIGTIAANEPLNSRIRKAVCVVGDKPGAQEVFLALRGLRTLRMRMQHVDRAGREMAAWFAEQPCVTRVLHPALESCPGHRHWVRDFSGAASLFGVVFRPCPEAAVHGFTDALTQFGIGVSWGGYESLVLPVKPNRTATAWEEPGPLIRFSIGFEDTETLKADLAAALPHLSR